MWARMAVGAIVGLGIGHFTEPGYVLWMTLGVMAGYLAELWTARSREARANGAIDDRLQI